MKRFIRKKQRKEGMSMKIREEQKTYTISIAGTGYVGLSNAILLAQHHKVYAVDILQEKVDLINERKSPIIDREIEAYLREKS